MWKSMCQLQYKNPRTFYKYETHFLGGHSCHLKFMKKQNFAKNKERGWWWGWEGLNVLSGRGNSYREWMCGSQMFLVISTIP